jgi:hypothetical protein
LFTDVTVEICKVNPFLELYQPVSEIPVARCCTIWTDECDSLEYLLVGDQMLWFGTLMPNLLINPNQLQAYGHDVNDDPFDSTREFGIDNEHLFIPFDTTGTIIHFKSHVPTEWEKTHLPIILLTGDKWNPTEEVLRPERQSCENVEMRTIRSLMSGMMRQQIRSVTKEEAKVRTEWHVEMDIELGKILGVYNPREFCECLISAVNIVTTYRDDIDKWNEEQRISSVISNE